MSPGEKALLIGGTIAGVMLISCALAAWAVSRHKNK
jgi:hypothetical protein